MEFIVFIVAMVFFILAISPILHEDTWEEMNRDWRAVWRSYWARKKGWSDE